MARIRVNATVDHDLLLRAHALRPGVDDATLLDEALSALLAREGSAAVDRAYAACDDQPLDTEDEWGDLASFRAAAHSS